MTKGGGGRGRRERRKECRQREGEGGGGRGTSPRLMERGWRKRRLVKRERDRQ